MRATILLVLALAACTSAEEKARERELAMIEAAQADSIAEAQFVEDSLELAKSITSDTVSELVVRVEQVADADGDERPARVFLALARNRTRCHLDSTRYMTLAVGDTLSCQWGPPE